MHLFIDAGNTRIKYAGHDGTAWVFRSWADSNAAAALSLPTGFIPQRILIASVATAETNAAMMRQLAGWAERIEWFRATAACAGLRNDYAQPTQLGADRWAAALGAWNLVRGACLVVNAGTATTLDMITSEGVFAGGCILPGLEMMRRSLAQGTADLPLAEGLLQARPRNTADAIFSGCLNAQLGAIERMRAALPAAAPLVLAGGAALALRDHLTGQLEWAPYLVLDGLLYATSQPQ